MKLYAKAKFKSSSVMKRDAIGHDGIEYMIRDKDYAGHELLIPEYFAPAKAVHVPFSACNIEDIDLTSVDKRYLAARLAQTCGEESGERCILVLHTENTPEQLTIRHVDKAVHTIEDLLCNFPDIEVAIENTTAFRRFQHGKSCVSSGHYDAPIKWAEMFGDRVGTCLDICHAIITKKYFTALFGVYGEELFDVSMEGFFRLNEPHLKLIHLAAVRGNGYGSGHGAPLDFGDRIWLKDFVRLHEKYAANIPVTLEVYNGAKGYEQSKKVIETLIEK